MVTVHILVCEASCSKQHMLCIRKPMVCGAVDRKMTPKYLSHNGEEIPVEAGGLYEVLVTTR